MHFLILKNPLANIFIRKHLFHRNNPGQPWTTLEQPWNNPGGVSPLSALNLSLSLSPNTHSLSSHLMQALSIYSQL